MELFNSKPDVSKHPLFFYGWVVVAVGFLTLAMVFGVWYSFSIFFLEIIKEFQWSRAATSSIFSVFILSHAIVGILAGFLQDRFGPRIVIPFGAMVMAISLALTSRTQSLWHFYLVYGLLAGSSMGLIGFASHSAFIPQWFERKRGLATGIAMSGIGFGIFLLVPLVEKSISIFGWRESYLYLAGMILFVVAPVNLLFSRHHPKDLNLYPDGDDPNRKVSSSTRIATLTVVDIDWASQEWTMKKAFFTKRFWFLVGAFFFGAFVYQGTLLHSVSAMVDAGLERNTAAFYFGVAGFFSAVGKILFGYLSDVLGRERASTLAGIFSATGLFCLINVTEFNMLMPIAFAVLFGLGYGAVAPIFPSIGADIFLGRSFGVIFAMVAIGGGIGGSSGPYICGLMRDIFGTYNIPFAFLFINLFFSCFLIWAASPRKIRKMVRNNKVS